MKQKIAILDYGIGNLRSAQKTFERAGAETELTADPATVAAADGVVLPGVGNFGRVVEAIRDRGIDTIASDAVRAGAPFMGICVGMQVLFESSDEVPDVPGLGLLKGRVRQLNDSVKRPQMQWNQLAFTKPSPLFEGLDEGCWVYFVHSYAPELTDVNVATCDYGGVVNAAVQRDNLFATQFHPEKSGKVGLRIVTNFLTVCGAEARRPSEVA